MGATKNISIFSKTQSVHTRDENIRKHKKNSIPKQGNKIFFEPEKKKKKKKIVDKTEEAKERAMEMAVEGGVNMSDGTNGWKNSLARKEKRKN